MATMLRVAREITVGTDTVSVYEYGDQNGQPVFASHGVPSCGAGFDLAHEPARARRLRLIAPDRPGVGRSTTRAGWGVGDYPALMMAMFTKAFERGARGVVDDPMVPRAHSQSLVDHVSGATLRVWAGEGHLATVAHVDEILDVLVKG
jgi:hypothetical protein